MTPNLLTHQLGQWLANYQTLSIAGAAFGDEGKGKVGSLLAGFYDIIARFSGAGNAGHTYFTAKGRKIVSHLIPCGLAANKMCVLGRGEQVRLDQLLAELAEAKKMSGAQPPRIYIDLQCPLWIPWHSLLEAYLEAMREGSPVGTTGQGVGPVAALHRLRIGPLIGEMSAGREYFLKRLETMYRPLAPIFNEMLASGMVDTDTTQIPTPSELADQLFPLFDQVKTCLADTSAVLHNAFRLNYRILAEGAQAVGLDLMWGTYPFVSSTMSSPAGAALGLGLPPKALPHTLLVTKVLPTRVGNGPFPSEIGNREGALTFPQSYPQLFQAGQERDEFLQTRLNLVNSGKATAAELSQYFQVLGDERGATTGRGRSVGYLDIPWLRYAVRLTGPIGLALTQLDRLSGLKQIPVVVDYKINGQCVMPGTIPLPWQWENVEVIMDTWECWRQSISGCQDYRDLPSAAREFVTRLAAEIRCPIPLVGTGPGQADMVFKPRG